MPKTALAPHREQKPDAERHLEHGSKLCGGKADVLISHDDLELLSTCSIRLRPLTIVFLEDFGVFYDPLEILDDNAGAEHLLADHGIVLVLAVVRIP